MLEACLCCLLESSEGWKNLICGSHLVVNSLKLFRFVILELRHFLIVYNNLQAHSPKYVDTEVPGLFGFLLGCFTLVILLMDLYHVQYMHLERS